VGASTTQPAPAADSAATDASAPPAAGNSGVLTFEVSQADALRIISANSGSSKLYMVLLPPTANPVPSSSGTKAAASK
jgi:hypothetical protein